MTRRGVVGTRPRQLITGAAVAAPSAILLGGLLRRLRTSEAVGSALADEHLSLVRVTNAVAEELSLSAMFRLVGAEAGRLLDQQEVVVVRGSAPGESVVIGGWRADGSEPEGDARPAGGVSAVISVHGVAWGRLCAPALSPDRDVRRAREAEACLSRLAGPLALAIGNADGRQQLLHRASTDPLTGLANHRTFHERLAEEMARCARYERPISVAMLDIDRFKQINDTVGHMVGDTVLTTVAQRILTVMRTDALVARLGGDEIAVILPECDAETARTAIERARRAVSEQPIVNVGSLTMSAGLCDNLHASTPDRILRLADEALYYAKDHGRDACVSYSPDVVTTVSESERAVLLARTQALTGLRTLARAIDTKEQATLLHSQRVAELAAVLAGVQGWSAERIELLREAALVHDIGKLAVREQTLSGNSRLSDQEFEQVKLHTHLGAQIAGEILDPEQVEWIRWHHERPDGGGYPDGLADGEIPDGASLLSLADAVEAMVSHRSYKSSKSLAQAIDECVGLAGTQFAPEAVAALLSAHEAGLLGACLLPSSPISSPEAGLEGEPGDAAGDQALSPSSNTARNAS